MKQKTETIDADAVLAMLSAESLDLPRAFDGLRALRAGADGRMLEKVDRTMLMRLGVQQRALAKVRVEVDGLKEVLERLTARPWFGARLRRCVTIDGKPVAEVAHGRALRLVGLARDLDPATLHPGDLLYLSSDLNVALALADEDRSDVGDIATVTRLTVDGRIVVSDQNAEVAIARGAVRPDESLKPGDEVIWDRDALMALATVDRQPHDTDGLLEEIGDTAPESLAGCDEMRDTTLRRFVQGIAHPEIANRYGLDSRVERLLLTGPPGTGKTTLMKNIAAQIAGHAGKPCRYRIVNGAELSSPYVGETERNIRQLFLDLADHDGPTIVFFDEVDAIGRVRGRPMGVHDDRAMGTFLSCIDGMRSNGSPIVIAATNRPDSLDPALRSRFSTEIAMARPRMDAARAILGVHLGDHLPFRPNGKLSNRTRARLIELAVSRLYDPNAENDIAVLRFRDSTRRTVFAAELVSGRLLRQICESARQHAFGRHAAGGVPGICEQDMAVAVDDAIDRMTRLLSRSNAGDYLDDLPQGNDVVSVEPARRHVPLHRYLYRGQQD